MNSYVLLVLSQVMLGSVAVFARWSQLPADVLVLFRCLFAATAIGLVVVARESIRPYLKPGKTLVLLLLTGVFMATNWLYFFKAVLATSITSAILLYNLAPIFVLISAVVFLKEMPTVRQVGAILTAFSGVVLILSSRSGGAGAGVLDGGIYALIAGALYAQVTILGRYLRSVPAVVITFFQTAVGAALFSVVVAGHLKSATFTPKTWVILATVGVFHTAVPYLMYFKALKTVKATVAGILQYVYTFSTIVFGVVFFNEAVTAATLAGGVIIIASSYVALKFPGKASLREVLSRVRRPRPLSAAAVVERSASC